MVNIVNILSPEVTDYKNIDFRDTPLQRSKGGGGGGGDIKKKINSAATLNAGGVKGQGPFNPLC